MFQKFTRLVLSGALAAGLLGTAASAAWAQTTPPATTPATQASTTPNPQLLALRFQRVAWLAEGQALHLQAAEVRADLVQAKIDEWAAAGKDVSALNTAMAAFDTAMVSATTQLDTAQGIIETRAGFDASGQVISTTLAQQTIQTASAALRTSHMTLRQGERALRQAIRAFVQANPDVASTLQADGLLKDGMGGGRDGMGGPGGMGGGRDGMGGFGGRGGHGGRPFGGLFGPGQNTPPTTP